MVSATHLTRRRDDDLAFGNSKGGPLRESKVLTTVLQPAGERAGLGRVTWHQFRHMHSSIDCLIATLEDVSGLPMVLPRHQAANHATKATSALPAPKAGTSSQAARLRPSTARSQPAIWFQLAQIGDANSNTR
jgi:hypothetical protein